MEKRYMSVSLKDMRPTTNKNSYKRYLTYIPSPSVSVGERIGYGAAGTVLGLGQGIASNKAQERYLLPQVQHRIRGLSREKKKSGLFLMCRLFHH